MKTSSFALASLLVIACSGSSPVGVPLPEGSATSTAPTDPSEGAASDGSSSASGQTEAPAPAPAPSSPAPSTTLDCKAYASAYCAKANACGHLVAKIMGSACAARIEGQCEARANATGSGRTPAALATCTNALSGLTCAEVFAETAPAACSFVGTLPLGSDCAFADQCATAACSASATKCGKCVVAKKTTPSPKAKLGETCDESGKSAPDCNSQLGLWCDGITKTCAEIASAAVGQSCGYLGGMIVMCASGGTCKPSAGMGSGTCVAEKGVGDACSSGTGYDECAFGTSCISGSCAYATAAALCK